MRPSCGGVRQRFERCGAVNKMPRRRSANSTNRIPAHVDFRLWDMPELVRGVRERVPTHPALIGIKRLFKASGNNACQLIASEMVGQQQ